MDDSRGGLPGLPRHGAPRAAPDDALLRRVADNGVRLHELTERIVRMEGHADEIHSAGLKRIFKEVGPKDPLRFVVLQEMFKRLERVVDRFEDVANEIDGLVIDHS